MLRYRLPRLRGKGKGLSQQAGGIGTRFGGGETQLEVDRRRLLRRINKLEAELKELTKNRRTQRKARHRSRLQTVAIVGYTNAGKSTLLNRLTDAGVLVEDRLFATLDPTTRRLDLPGGERVLLTDTVGLRPQAAPPAGGGVPVDAGGGGRGRPAGPRGRRLGAPTPRRRSTRCDTVLREIGADEVPELLAFNKADLGRRARSSACSTATRGRWRCRRATGEGVDGLLEAVGDRLRLLSRTVELLVPYERGDVVAALHRQGEVLSEDHEDDATRSGSASPDPEVNRFADFLA